MNNLNFNEPEVRKILETYPNLKVLFKAGLISRSLCREALNLTKWEMSDLYVDLAKYGAINIQSTSAFKATPETRNLVDRMNDEIEKAEREKHIKEAAQKLKGDEVI